jgi:hypothetical protein
MQITSLRDQADIGGFGPIRPSKKQGRRRSMTPTTLPAPDIEIGSRRPVGSIVAEP